MSEINANENSSVSESLFSTFVFNFIEDINLSIQFMNPDAINWFNLFPNVKMTKKAIEQIYFSESEEMTILTTLIKRNNWNHEIADLTNVVSKKFI